MAAGFPQSKWTKTEQSTYCNAFYDLASKVTVLHFFNILLVTQVCSIWCGEDLYKGTILAVSIATWFMKTPGMDFRVRASLSQMPWRSQGELKMMLAKLALKVKAWGLSSVFAWSCLGSPLPFSWHGGWTPPPTSTPTPSLVSILWSLEAWTYGIEVRWAELGGFS